MKIGYSGISGNIGDYIDELRSKESVNIRRAYLDWEEPLTFSIITDYDRLFLAFPINKVDILSVLPEFVKHLRKDQTLIKFGSLGPQRCVHDIIDAEIRKHCNLITLQLSHVMSSLITEQVDGSVLYDFRFGNPSPYVSPEAAAQAAVWATEKGLDADVIEVTGPENLNINQVRDILNDYLDIQTIQTMDGKKFVEEYRCSEELKQAARDIYDQYKTSYPEVSSDLRRNGIPNMTLSKWMSLHYVKK